MMTIDKIRHYLNPDIYNYWISCTDAQAIERARIDLEQEINSGILTDVKYYAELNLLKSLLK